MTSAQTAPEAGRILYELAGADAEVRFSPHCWKVRMALAHKGLDAERRPWRFTEKDRIAFSGQGLVPVLLDDGVAVSDSWRIALHLDARYPDRPALFAHEESRALARFVNIWCDTTLVPALARTIALDIHDQLDAADRSYFRTSREQRFGTSLEALTADRPARIAAFRQALGPLRALLRDQPFLCGDHAAYADYCVFGTFMWSRCISDAELLEADDPVFAWRERLLDLFGGLARSAPMAGGA